MRSRVGWFVCTILTPDHDWEKGGTRKERTNVRQFSGMETIFMLSWLNSFSFLRDNNFGKKAQFWDNANTLVTFTAKNLKRFFFGYVTYSSQIKYLRRSWRHNHRRQRYLSSLSGQQYRIAEIPPIKISGWAYLNSLSDIPSHRQIRFLSCLYAVFWVSSPSFIATWPLFSNKEDVFPPGLTFMPRAVEGHICDHHPMQGCCQSDR